MKAYTKLQPVDGETVLMCAHALDGGKTHFYHMGWQEVLRPDGSKCRAQFIAICESCHTLHGDDPMSVVRRDGMWRGDEPEITEPTKN